MIPRLKADAPSEHPNTKRRKQAKPERGKEQAKPERAGLDPLIEEVSISKVGRRKVEISSQNFDESFQVTDLS